MKKCTTTNPTEINSDNVYYSGSYLPTLDISTNTNLTQVLQILDTYLASFTGGNDYIIHGGTNNQTANGLTTTFNIPHTLGVIPTTYSVEAVNQQSASNFSVDKSLTNLIITYSVAPSQGTELSWVWQATKI